MSEAPELTPALERALTEGGQALDRLREAGASLVAELGRAAAERDQARREYDTAQRGLAAAGERLRVAGEESRRLQAELEEAKTAWAAREREVEEQVGRHGEQLAALRDELAATTRDRDDLQAAQAQWGAEREELARRLDGTEAELRALKARHAELFEQSNRLAADWAARRQALAAEIHAQNEEMEQVRRALRDAGDQLPAAPAAAASLTPELAHELGSRLNAVLGFSSVLAEDRAGTISPEDRREFVRNLHDSAQRLAGAIERLTGPRPAIDLGVAVPGGNPPRKAPDILVADPDPAVRERIEPFLKRAGYDVVFVTTAADALEKATGLQPLAILIDAQLPPDGAGSLLRELRRDRRAREIPLVLMVGADGPPPPLTEYEMLLKPIDRQQLVQMMVKFDLLADGRKAKKMPPSVLLIDDDPQVASLLKAVLRPFNVKLSVAETARTGIEHALRQPPDLIVLDLVMPDQDGFEVIAALRRDGAASGVPILVQTAKVLTEEDRRRLEGQVQSVIAKGTFQPERLLELLLKRGERRRRTAEQRPAA